MNATRSRPDRCPGAMRPWPADDGLLVRLRLIGGAVSPEALSALIDVAERHGTGRIHLTTRANLQIRGLPNESGALPDEVLADLRGTALLPSLTHELVRNVLVSPLTGVSGGRADLSGVARALDEQICADPLLARLPGRFLFVLDDGRGDVVDRDADLGLVALDSTTAQLRLGDGWGPVVPLDQGATALADLARLFLDRRGDGPQGAWHVAELEHPLVPVAGADPRVPECAGPLPFGAVPGGRHVQIPEAGLDRASVAALVEGAARLVVTPWRGVVVIEKETP